MLHGLPNIRLVAVLVAAVLAVASPVLSGGAAADQRPGRLADAFEEIVFGAAGPAPRDILLRIEGPVVFLPKGPFTPQSLALLASHAAALSDLTGFPVRVEMGEEIGSEERTFWIYLVSDALAPAVVERRWIAPPVRAMAARALCSFVTRGDHRIMEAVIVIKRHLEAATVNHCLIEETSQALGAIDDTRLLDPSAFNDLGGLVGRLQPDDRAILRALFSEELRAGMTRAEVAERLPGLIERALAAEGR